MTLILNQLKAHHHKDVCICIYAHMYCGHINIYIFEKKPASHEELNIHYPIVSFSLVVENLIRSFTHSFNHLSIWSTGCKPKILCLLP